MKNFLFSISILCIVSSVTAQSSYDSIYTFNEGVLAVTVKEITSDAVKYAYPNEDLLNSIAKNSIQRIVFKSGRTQVFAEASSFKKVTCVEDWENVSISRLESEVKGLYKIGDVSVKAKSGGFASSSKIKDRAYRKLKIEAALKGANVVYVVEETSVGNQMGNQYSAGQAAETQISGIAYTNVLPKFEDFVKVLEGKSVVLINEVELGNNSMDFKIESIPNTPTVISNPQHKDNLIFVNAKIQGAKTSEFRVTNFNETSIILMDEYKGKITNYTLIIM
jgi:hypothetical protein